jgi:hypothetical protein
VVHLQLTAELHALQTEFKKNSPEHGQFLVAQSELKHLVLDSGASTQAGRDKHTTVNAMRNSFRMWFVTQVQF